MNWTKLLKFIPLIILFFNCLRVNAHEPEGDFKFIENKGQWHNWIHFKADLRGGTVYLENGGFVFDFYDMEAMELFGDAHAGSKDWLEVPESLNCHAYKMIFNNSSMDADLVKRDKSSNYHNYFLGTNKEKWASKAHEYKTIRYKELYPNIDLEVYSRHGAIKYDFIIRPGGNVKDIDVKYEGVDKTYINKKGDLVVLTSVNNVIETKPFAYQNIRGERRIIPCKYVLDKKNNIRYKFPNGYNKDYDLIIDPELIFSTYSGSTANNFGYTASFDELGYVYTGSSAFANGYPTTLGAYKTTFSGGKTDMAISKFDTTGKKLIYSTYLGGSGDDLPHSIVVSRGELYVYGTTESKNYPVTLTAISKGYNGGNYIAELRGLGVLYHGGSDMVVSRLSVDGSDLLASTYLGGSNNDGLNYDPGCHSSPVSYSDTVLKYNYADEIRGEILVDKFDDVYVVGCTRSTNFPTTPGSFQPVYGGGFLDGVVVKLNKDLSKIIWSSFIGGNNSDAVYSIALDNKQDLVVTGGTRSINFPVTTGVLKETYNGGRSDGFVSRITRDGKTITKSTFVGSDVYDQSYFVELDRADNVFLLGQTEALDSTFIINAAYSSPKSGQFITKISEGLDTIHWSTVFGSGGGGPNISPTAFLVDLCSKIYISGWGGATNTRKSTTNNKAILVDGMEITPDAFQPITADKSDFYIMVMEDDASKVVYGSYFGGPQSAEHVDGGTSRFDRRGRVYQAVCAGCGGNSDFPIYPPDAHSPKNKSSCNLGVFKFDFNIPQTIADFDAPNVVCLPATIKLTNKSYNALKFEWDFGNGKKSTEKDPTVTYDKAGIYTITLKAINGGTCNLEDSVVKEIEIRENQIRILDETSMCKGDSVQIGIQSESGIDYNWIPPTGLSNPKISNPKASPNTTTVYSLVEYDGYCYDTVRQKVNVIDLPYVLTSDSVFCVPTTVTVSANTFGSASTYHWSTKKDFSDMINANLATNTANVFVSGKKTLYIKMNNAYCERIDSVILDLYPNRVDVIPDTSMCWGDTLTLYALGDTTLGEWVIHWEPVDSIITNPDSAIVKVSPQKSIWYYVDITLGTCSFRDSVYVEVLSFPGVNFAATAEHDTIIKGECTFLHAFPDTIKNYQWSPPDLVETPNAQTTKTCPTQTTTYMVTAGNNICKDNVAYVKVVVLDFVCDYPYIFVPNAFTPNKNDKNERVYVRGKYIEEMYFAIYDRWGEKVFETKDQNIGWDGRYKGREADPGVFVYYLEATCVGKKNYFKKGNITLIK